MTHLLLSSVALVPLASVADTYMTPVMPAQAVVFSKGALVTSRAVLDMASGTHDVVFVMPEGVFEGIIVPRISVAGAEVAGIYASRDHSQDPRSFYTEGQQDVIDQLRATKAQVQTLERSVADLDAQIAAIDQQIAYLSAIWPKDTQTLAELQEMADFVPTALVQAGVERESILVDKSALLDDLEQARSDVERMELLVESAGIPDETWVQITVHLTVSGDAPVTVTTHGYTSDAGWDMTYRAYLDENAQKIDLQRDALIHQNSGQAWDDVLLTLSSARPYQDVLPNLPRRDEVDLIKPYKGTSRESAPLVLGEVAVRDEVVLTSGLGNAPGRFDGVAVDFILPETFDLPNSYEVELIAPLESLSIPVQVDRFANARRDEFAFVRAQFDNETGQPILPGQASFYWNDTLVGQDNIDLIPTQANGQLFFGPD
ncbi:MAG: DUF4139 domain-containing protein, partial [Pseudomonadota bacterium]